MPVSIGNKKIKIMIQTLSNLWKEAKTPTDYIVAMWVYLLLGLFTVSWVSIVL